MSSAPKNQRGTQSVARALDTAPGEISEWKSAQAGWNVLWAASRRMGDEGVGEGEKRRVASVVLFVDGFSRSTCLPAFRARAAQM